MQEQAIVVKELNKIYPIYKSGREKYMDFFLPGNHGKRFQALRNVSFEVEKGQSIGLLGLNGSGKSTLANIIAGSTSATSGTVFTDGNVAVSAISGGINPLLTGLENITQKCLLLGLNHKQIRELLPGIVDFSELGDFIGQPTKNYSSGMRAKLSFSISVNIDPDILVIDEGLSVGDPTFTEKCLRKMRSFREAGKTIIFVSHSLPQVRDFCDRALWLEGGEMRCHGECKEVVNEYAAFIRNFNALSAEEQKAYKDEIYARQLGADDPSEA